MSESAAALLAAAMGGNAALRALRRGEPLFRQDDPAAAVFAVEAGRVRLLRHTSEGSVVTVAVARAGETLAEAALFAERYHCDAVADLPSRVLAYAKPALLAALRADPDLAARFLAVLARQVQSLRARLELRSLRSARQRVLAYLTLEGTDDRPDATPRPVRDLATDLGLTPEALYRTLARLEAVGLVVRDGRRLRLAAPRKP